MKKPAIIALITVEENAGYYLSNRNFKPFGGKPLFRFVIDKLLKTNNISQVVITTDSEEVRSAYQGNSNVTLLSYPADLSEEEKERGVLPTSDRLTAHALKQVPGEHFIQLQSVTPLLTPQSVEEAIHRYYQYVLNGEGGQFDSVMSLFRIEKKLYTVDYPAHSLREDPAFVIVEDTVLNIFNRTAFVRNGNRKFGTWPMFFETPEIEGLAVETDHSYTQAKLIHENKHLFSTIFEREAYLPALE